MMLLSFVLMVSYGVQTYLTKEEEKPFLSMEEKIASVRSSSDSQSRNGQTPRSSWVSNDVHRIEKAE
jgi:hypothetical protein